VRARSFAGHRFLCSDGGWVRAPTFPPSLSCAGKYVGNRPVKLRKSSWKDRMLDHRDEHEMRHMHELKQSKLVKKKQ
jgi:hypothetical protein